MAHLVYTNKQNARKVAYSKTQNRVTMLHKKMVKCLRYVPAVTGIAIKQCKTES